MGADADDAAGKSFRLGTVHFWLGIATTALVLVLAGWRRFRVASDRHTHSVELAGGADLSDFRHVHGHLLFPQRMVSDRDFNAIDAYLKTLG